jgi:hypothetical protein
MNNHYIKKIKLYREHFPHRQEYLFNHFLLKGYQLTTLSSVADEFLPDLLSAKLHLGMLITLFDDFADHPNFNQPQLLDKLYQLPYFHRNPTSGSALDEITQTDCVFSKAVIGLTIDICEDMIKSLSLLPHYACYSELFIFDLKQFHQCNRYFEILRKYPKLKNLTEIQYYSSYNMGIVLVGIMDIMASPNFDMNELGISRELFILAQRYAKISNNLVTFDREISEQDYSSELLMVSENHALKEQKMLLQKMLEIQDKLKSFDAMKYINSMQQLHHLHEESRGII